MLIAVLGSHEGVASRTDRTGRHNMSNISDSHRSLPRRPSTASNRRQSEKRSGFRSERTRLSSVDEMLIPATP